MVRGLLREADGLGVYLEAKEVVGLDAEVVAVVHGGLPVELVGGDVEVAVAGEAHGVGPKEAGVVGEGFGDAGGGVPAVDGVGDGVGHVDVAGAVGLEAVRGHFAGDDADAGFDVGVGFGAVAEKGGGDGVELGGVDGAVVEVLAVVGDGDAVGGKDDGLGGVAGEGLVDGGGLRRT